MNDETPMHLELPDGHDGYRLACGLPVLEVAALEMDVRPSTDVRADVTCHECRRSILPPHWAVRYPFVASDLPHTPRSWVLGTDLIGGLTAAAPQHIEEVVEFYRRDWE